MTVSDLQNRLSSDELTQWIAFYSLEPWGFRNDWLQIGTISALIFNANRGRGGKVAKASDFVPKQKRYQTPNQQIAIAKTIHAFHNRKKK